MTRKQAYRLFEYFDEMECSTIETHNFCDNRSDNAIIGSLLKNGEIKFIGDDEYVLTEKGIAAYEEITGESVPE